MESGLNAEERLQIAYTLLPPPLSALPAKYWTSISLLVHSYTVGRTFEELIRLVGDDSLQPEEAFIIGFLHDLAQKLGKSEESLRTTYRWVLDELVNELKWPPNKARKVAKTLETNPAENIRHSDYTDPMLPSKTWKLLMLADELQGTTDAISWALKAKDVIKKEYGTSLEISVYSINLPQPFVKAEIWGLIEERISKTCEALPIASLQGVVVLSKCKIQKITISWDEIVDRAPDRRETAILDEVTVSALEEHVDRGCPGLVNGSKENVLKDVYMVSDKNKKGKYADAIFPLPKSKHCKPGTKHERAGTYELLLHYFGPKGASKLTGIVLPSYVKDSLLNINIEGVEYGDGSFICPMCGARHSEGFIAGIVGDVIGSKSEKWSRFLPITISKSLNQALRETSRVRICPLCMLDILLNRQVTQVSSDRQFSPYFTLSLQTPVPVSVLKEIAGLMHVIVWYTLSSLSLKDIGSISERINTLLKNPHRILSQVKTLERGALLDYGSLMVSTNGAVRFVVSLSDLKLQDKLVFVAVAGLLGYYGVYPITITLGYPPAVPTGTNQLINYEVTYPLYGYRPSEKKYENCAPFVTAVLASIPGLYHIRDSPNERIRHVEEVLGFEPTHAPLLLLYSNPQVYSHVDRLISMFLGGERCG